MKRKRRWDQRFRPEDWTLVQSILASCTSRSTIQHIISIDIPQREVWILFAIGTSRDALVKSKDVDAVMCVLRALVITKNND